MTVPSRRRPPAIVEVAPDAAELVARLADALARAARQAIAGGGVFHWALAGGSTPASAYRLLAARYADQVDWRRVHLWLGDERVAPPGDPARNESMIRATLLSAPETARATLHAPPDGVPPERAAALYAEELERRLPRRPDATGREVPSFDLALLGVGTDGHTASLFPGDPMADERDRWAGLARAPAGVAPRLRITVTSPVFEATPQVHVLACGAAKRAVVSAILAGAPSARAMPLARLAFAREIVWWLDRDAAPVD